MKRWGLLGFVFVISAAGCGGGSTPGPGGRIGSTCSQLGWVCGLDDFGTSCGSCSGSSTCSNGRCVIGQPVCDCTGRSCGPNSCGTSSCGNCQSNQTCSGGICVNNAPMPTDHTLGQGSLPLFGTHHAVTFSIPVAATVRFDTQTTAGDTYDVGIYDASQWMIRTLGGRATAYGYRPSGMSAASEVQLPAGAWMLGFYCTNTIQRCAVRYTLTARY